MMTLLLTVYRCSTMRQLGSDKRFIVVEGTVEINCDLELSSYVRSAIAVSFVKYEHYCQ